MSYVWGDSHFIREKVLTTLLNYVVIFSSFKFYGGFVYRRRWRLPNMFKSWT